MRRLLTVVGIADRVILANSQVWRQRFFLPEFGSNTIGCSVRSLQNFPSLGGDVLSLRRVAVKIFRSNPMRQAGSGPPDDFVSVTFLT